MAARRLVKNGKNVISPPPKNLTKKIFFYIFGGKHYKIYMHAIYSNLEL